MLNTGTSLISDVLGKDNKSAAFVYGVYSLFDKFKVYLVEKFVNKLGYTKINCTGKAEKFETLPSLRKFSLGFQDDSISPTHVEIEIFK